MSDILDEEGAGARVIRGGSTRTIGYVAGILVGLASTPIMVRHLGVADFGRFVTVTSIIFIAQGLTEGGLAGIGVREYSTRDGGARDRLLRDLLGLRLALTLVAAVGAICFGLLAGYPDVMVGGLVLASVGLLLQNVGGMYSVPMTSWLELGRLAALDFLRQATTSAAVVALVVVNASLSPFFAVTILANGLALVVTYALVRGRAPFLPGFDRQEWARLLRASLPYAAAIAMSVLYFRFALVVMSVMSTETETGLYSLAFRIVEIVSGVPWLLVSSVFPILSRAARDDSVRLRFAVGRTFEVSLILGVLSAIGLGLGAPFAVDVIGGLEDFGDSVPVLSVLGVALIGTFLIACWSHALLSLHRQVALMQANFGAFVVGAVLTIVLVDAEGALGGAIATTAVELGLAIAYLLILVRLDRAMTPRVGFVLRVVVAAGLAVGVCVLISPPSVVSAILGAVLYLGLLAAFRAIPPEILEALRRRRA